jgi:5-methylcytosine-specific restriction endonuclease McrA
VASRYPTRAEYNAAVPSDTFWDPDDWDPDSAPPERPGSRKPQKLHRLPKGRGPRRKWTRTNVSIGGLLSQREYGKLKEQVFARAGQCCERCGTARGTGHLTRLTPHHRRPLAQGGEDRASNLAALCPVCHDWVHDHPVESWAHGWLVPSYASWADAPMLLADGRLVYLTDDADYEQAS